MKPKLPNMINVIMEHLWKPSMPLGENNQLRIIGRINLPGKGNAGVVSHTTRAYVAYPVEGIVRLNVNEIVQEKIM